MRANRLSSSLAVLLMFAVALVSVSFATRPGGVTATDNLLKKEAGFSNVVSNTSLPLPPGKQAQLYYAARGSSDFYQRHPNWNSSAAGSAAAYSDYAERHPELSAPASSSIDMTDYYFRHPELNASSAQASIDLTDYYFRHINV